MRGSKLAGGPGAPPPTYETKRRAPVQCPCPTCGKKGRRKRIRRRTVRHLAHKQPAFWTLVYGVYAATCACAKFFTAAIEGVALRCGYTDAVRQKAVDLLIRDHLSVYKVQRHLEEDFALSVSIGFIYDCFDWAYRKIDRAAYWAWVLEHFSGALCIDEVHDCRRTILVATDPVNDFTVAFLVVPENSQRNMNRFLDLLKCRGLHVRVAISDGSPLYKKALVERWEGLQRQLCVFHFLRDQMMDILAGLRQIRNDLPVNPCHRRGRPSKRGRPRKDPKWRRQLLTDHMHLVIKNPGKLTRRERKILRTLAKLDRRIQTLRVFTHRMHGLFSAASAQAARNRRTRLLADRRFKREPLLKEPLRRLEDDQAFETLIVSLSWHRVPRTNNHVERKNRSFRLVQKTRYKRRKPYMIKRAYWLHLEREWKHHPLLLDRKATPAHIRRRPRKRRRHGPRILQLPTCRRRPATRLRRPA
jgi:hypothetical protein